MVSSAVAAKGRSSSSASNRLQITTLPYLLGANLRLVPLPDRATETTTPAAGRPVPNACFPPAKPAKVN